jgi:transitional endoplasmic reticulum ATPase
MRDPVELRPRIERSRHRGALVEVADAAGLLAGATGRPADVVAEATLREPVSAVVVTVATDTSDGVPAYALGAVVRLRRPARAASPLGDLAADVGAAAAPAVAAQLLRAAGKLTPVAAVAAGASAAALRGYSTRVAAERRDTRPAYRDIQDQVVEDPLTGLRATVRCAPTSRGQQVTVRATVPAAGDRTGGSPVLGFGRVVAGVLAAAVTGVARVDLAAGGSELAGDRLVLGRVVADRSRADGLDRIGGLHHVVEQFRDVVAAFTHPERMEFFGARAPRGILLYGPPGTGKTTLARALAAEVGARLVEVQTPDLVTKWLGDSAKHMRQVFEGVKSEKRPVVLLFDEFDSVVSYVSDGSTSGADQERNSMAGVFKQQMNDLLDTNPRAIVVATTNYLDRIDGSLIRSGRFDLRIEVPLPDETGRREILTKIMRREIARWEKAPHGLFAEDVDPAGLAVLSAGMSGADLVEVVRRAQHAAAVRYARTGVAVPITQSDLSTQVRAVRLSTTTL